MNVIEELEKAKARDARLRKIALDLFERCESEELTVWEFKKVLAIMEEALEHRAALRKQQG